MDNKTLWEQALLISKDGPQTTKLFTGKGRGKTLLTDGYIRVVIGGRGPYVELSNEQIQKTYIHIPQNQEWRLTPEWSKKVFYIEYRTNLGNVMLYQQLRTVSYADYKPGLWYVSPYDLVLEDEGPVITGTPPQQKK